MKVVKTSSGVVAEKDGLFWGVQYTDGQCTAYNFGPIENAYIANPEFCNKPENLTYAGDSLAVSQLRQARLVPITVTTTYEIPPSANTKDGKEQ